MKASATIRPTGELRLVQAGTDGSIQKIVVQVNQVVKKGDVIDYIDDSRNQTKKSHKKYRGFGLRYKPKNKAARTSTWGSRLKRKETLNSEQKNKWSSGEQAGV